jgi:mRNA interferase MazF
MPIKVARGDIVWVDFGPVRGRCKADPHPAVVVQNDKGNQVSPMTIVIPLTDKRQYKNLPIQVLLTSAETGLQNKESCAEAGHIATIDVDEQIDQQRGVVGKVVPAAMQRIDDALRVSLAL